MIRETKTLKTKIDIEKLRQFYHTLESNFQHLKFVVEDDIDSDKVEEGVGGHKVNGVFGWALQSNLEDLNKPCPPYNITKEEKREYRDTDAMFGIVQQIRNQFPYAHQFSIVAHPPGTLVDFHTDNTDWLKVHVPIYTNDAAYFRFPPNRRFVLPADGSMILVNTSIEHGTLNDGETDRVHLFFKVPHDKEREVVKTEGYIE